MRHLAILSFFVVCLSSDLGLAQSAADAPPLGDLPPQDSSPIAAGLTAEQAARHMSVPQGFKVTVVAAEPRVHQPIAFTFDHRGRIWIAEAHTYPRRAPEGQGRDRIVIFDDQDGDGTFETRTVFTENLNLVSGLEVGFGGVWVGSAPYLQFIPDRDQDDQPDGPPHVLLDGFGYQDTHETLNSFIWGPDGWLYGCHGVFTHSKVGKPGTRYEDRVPLNAGVWRYHPTRHEFDVFARGTSNPWGVDFDQHGQAFMTACVIPHLYHVIQGARYQRQGGRHFNPYVYDDIKTIADHRHYAGDIRDHAWWGREPVLPKNTSAAGGGHAHCGAMIYLGDNWPDQYRNQLLMNNIHGNRVNVDYFERHGSGFVGKHGPDFLLANDQWFRGINLKYGPDGTVYLIDWYDKNACHRVNPEIWDRTTGRVYRVAYGQPKAVRVNLAGLADEELVDLHAMKNQWHVRMARRILQERAARGGLQPSAVAKLDEIVQQHGGSPLGLNALWTMHAVGELPSERLLWAMRHDDEYLRAWAIQLACEQRAASSGELSEMVLLSRHDPSPVVRLYLASALQNLSASDRWGIAEGLVDHGQDASDHNLPLMIWYGVEPLVTADTTRAMRLATTSKIPLITQYILRRAASDDQLVDGVVQGLAASDSDENRHVFLDALLGAFSGRVDIPMPASWSGAFEKLLTSSDETVKTKAIKVAVSLGDERIFPVMRQRLSDAALETEKRREALDVLVRGRDRRAAPSLLSALFHPDLQAPALRALAAYTDDSIAETIISAYSGFQAAAKRDAINTLSARPSWAMSLLTAIDTGHISGKDLHAYNVRQMRSFENSELNARISEIWGEVRESSADKKTEIARWKNFLSKKRPRTTNVSNGRRLFVKHCANCHRLFGEGDLVGPDITGSNRANLDYILENLLDPNAVVGNDYRMTVIFTQDGRVIQGLVEQETDSAITLRTINDQVVIPKREIEERMMSEKSMMPEDQLTSLSRQEVRDLVAYLASPVQVPIAGPRAPIDPQTGRVPGAIEGESMKILSKSSGEAHSQNMQAFTNDQWSGGDQLWWTGAKPDDRLVVEVPISEAGTYQLELVLTRAQDYGIVQLSLDDEKLGGPIDLYSYPDVMTTGILSFDVGRLESGSHRLGIDIVGANPRAIEAFMVGIDFVRFLAVE